MPKRRIIRLVVLVAAALLAAYLEYARGGGAVSDAPSPGHDSREIVLTKHAKCRMGCREIRMEEISGVLAEGRVNQRKSDPGASPCPVRAYEGRTLDGPLARVVVAECPDRRKIITVIDLENEYDCRCR